MIYEVKSPILGFEKIKKMKLEKVDEVFAKLSDAENENVAFTLVNPFMLREYDITIPDNFTEKLNIDKTSIIQVFNIMILQNPIRESTINFLAPLIFNDNKKTMGQIILDGNKYTNYSIADKISNYIK